MTFYKSKTLKSLNAKFYVIDYVGEISGCAKKATTNSCMGTICFPAFLGSRTATMESCRKVNYGSKGVFPVQGEPFWGPVDYLSPEGVENPKNCQNLTPKG